MSYNQFVTNLNKFYTNIVDFIFSNDSKPDEKTIEVILRVVTKGQIQVFADNVTVTLPIKSNYKSSILQVLFQNYSHLVQCHFDKWFNNCTDAFASANELAVFFQSCVYDKHFHQLTNKSDDMKLEIGLDLCEELARHKSDIKLFFKQAGTQFRVEYLVFIGKLKCSMEILAYFCNSEEGLNKLENLDRFKEFNKRMQQVFEVWN